MAPVECAVIHRRIVAALDYRVHTSFALSNPPKCDIGPGTTEPHVANADRSFLRTRRRGLKPDAQVAGPHTIRSSTRRGDYLQVHARRCQRARDGAAIA